MYKNVAKFRKTDKERALKLFFYGGNIYIYIYIFSLIGKIVCESYELPVQNACHSDSVTHYVQST